MEKIILRKEYLELIKKEKQLLDDILVELNYEYLEDDMNADLHNFDTVESLRTKLTMKNESINYNYDSVEYLKFLKFLSEEKYEELSKYEIK